MKEHDLVAGVLAYLIHKKGFDTQKPVTSYLIREIGYKLGQMIFGQLNKDIFWVSSHSGKNGENPRCKVCAITGPLLEAVKGTEYKIANLNHISIKSIVEFLDKGVYFPTELDAVYEKAILGPSRSRKSGGASTSYVLDWLKKQILTDQISQ